MKKLFLVGALTLFGAMNAQTTGNFKIGAHVGLPVGDLADVSDFNLGADIAYVWDLAENFKAGVTTGYSYYIGGKTYSYTLPGYGTVSMETEGSGIIPLAATAEYAISPNFFIGGDIGYAFFTESGDGDSGAIYYQPKIGYKFNTSEIYLGYKGMSRDGSSISSINLGYAYTFGK